MVGLVQIFSFFIYIMKNKLKINNFFYKILSSSIEYKTSNYLIKKDRLRSLKNNYEFDYNVLVKNKAVFIIPFYKKSIYLIEQYRYPIDKLILEVPAGGLANNKEKPHDCAIRELREETGFCAKKIDYIGKFFMSPGISNQEAEVFVATNLIKKNNSLDKTETITNLKKISLNKINKYIKNGKIESGYAIACIYLFLNFLKNEKYF